MKDFWTESIVRVISANGYHYEICMNQDGLGCVDFVYFEDGKELCTIPIEKEVVHMVSDAFLKFMEASS